MTVSDLLEQPCNKSDNVNKVVTTVNKLLHTFRHDGLFVDRAKRCEIFVYTTRLIAN